jgi:hypothetical protein
LYWRFRLPLGAPLSAHCCQILSHTPLDSARLCIVLLLVLREFAGFVMVFLRLHKILTYLEETAERRCVVEGEEVLSAKFLILCGVIKVVETR